MGEQNIVVTNICPGPVKTLVDVNAFNHDGSKYDKTDSLISHGMWYQWIKVKVIKVGTHTTCIMYNAVSLFLRSRVPVCYYGEPWGVKKEGQTNLKMSEKRLWASAIPLGYTQLGLYIPLWVWGEAQEANTLWMFRPMKVMKSLKTPLKTKLYCIVLHRMFNCLCNNASHRIHCLLLHVVS